MTTLQNMTPETTPAAPGSFRERARATWQKIATAVNSPHASVTEVGARQRVQLQATFSLILVIMFMIGTLASVAASGIMGASQYVLIFLTALGVAAYFISRSRFYGIGGHLITGGVVFAAFAFLFTGQGSARALDSFIPLSMVLGSLLLSPVGVGFWTFLAVSVIFFIPPEFGIDTGTVAGNYITLGALLTVSVIFRNTIERSRLGELRTINSSLRELQVGLEERVAERTQSLELAAEVGRSVSQVRALDVMLKDAAELIRSRFDLYYVQVYLTDPSQSNLILQSGTGTVGAELVGRGHRLPLDTASINGRAAVEKRSVVIEDTAASAAFKPNPLLPDTRSEMAVPLLIGEKVVGVLDMQSQQANALNQDTLIAFEALAGQLAIAIQNATSLAETQQARAEVESQARRLTRTNWDEYMDAIHQPEETGFVFEQNQIAPLTGEEPVKEYALVAPITITGEALGNLIVEMEGGSPIARTEELVNTVAQQVARQIESLRLLDSAERYRFDAEEASRRLTREGWKDYTDANAASGLSYIYDLKGVRPFSQAGDQQVEESAFNVPLKIRDETIGKLMVQGLEADDSEALSLANAVAERLGAHIESLRLFDQAQYALSQTEKLSEASLRFAQAENLQELLTVTVEKLGIPVINRSLLGVFNYNSAQDMEDMVIVANWWNGSGHEPSEIGRRYTMETLNALPFLMSTTPVFSKDTFDDERIAGVSLQLVQSQNIRSMAVLPLFLGSQQIGVVFLEFEETHSFSQSDIRLFTAMAPQIATKLENRRQFEKAQQQAERESTLNLIGQKIRSATSVDAVLQIAARELGHALGAPLTIAQLGLKDKK